MTAIVGTSTTNHSVNPWVRRLAIPLVILVGIAIVGAVLGNQIPTWLDAHVKPFFDSIYKWTVRNNATHWLFTRIFNPIKDSLRWSVRSTLSLLRYLRWPGVLTLAGLIGWRTGGLRATVVGVLCLTGCGVMGLWDPMLETMALMLVSVAIALLIGVPLGIWAGLSDKTERRLRAVLDATQVLPTFVYLLPAVVLFGIGNAGAVLVTVVYAVAPAVRLTSLGIRSVPEVTTEAGLAFGATRRQLLRKIRIPMARRTILLGMNQVIMMAFGIVVIAALIGTGGLGILVFKGVIKADVGKSFAPGLALVLLAIGLDRVSTGEKRVRKRTGRFSAVRQRFRNSFVGSPWSGAASALAALIAVVGVVVIAHLLGLKDFASWPRVDVIKPVNRATNWVNDHFRKDVPVIGGTKNVSDFFALHLLNPARESLQFVWWWLIVVAAAAIGWASGGWRLGALSGVCFVGIASLRVWDIAMDTLSLVAVSVVASILIAIPLGLWSARSDRVNSALRPLLEGAQVMPQFVYLVPVLFFFPPGHFPAVIAAVTYAIPPAIRLVSLGMREVANAPREAATAFGATPRQEMFKVQIPLAGRAIMLGLNQLIMMVLAVVAIAGLIGAEGLGLETYYGVAKKEIGRGFAGGLAIVLLAIFLDRVTQAWGKPRKTMRSTI